MGPQGLLFDYGGTLVEEVSVDLQAGRHTAWMFDPRRREDPMKTARVPAPTVAHAEKQPKAFIGKFTPRGRQLIRTVRTALHKWFATTTSWCGITTTSS
jgi:hypothetical protein